MRIQILFRSLFSTRFFWKPNRPWPPSSSSRRLPCTILCTSFLSDVLDMLFGYTVGNQKWLLLVCVLVSCFIPIPGAIAMFGLLSILLFLVSHYSSPFACRCFVLFLEDAVRLWMIRLLLGPRTLVGRVVFLPSSFVFLAFRFLPSSFVFSCARHFSQEAKAKILLWSGKCG